MYTLPRAFLDVKIDGRATFFEWLSAGHYTCQNERGTMAMATHGPLQGPVFRLRPERAADPRRLRRPGPRRPWPTSTRCASASSSRPAGRCASHAAQAAADAASQLLHAGRSRAGTAARGRASTRSSRWRSRSTVLGVEVDQPVQFFVELLQGGQSRDRAPREGTIDLTRPSPRLRADHVGCVNGDRP